MAESLLPGTDAITRNTLEYSRYRGKWLVRYKDRDGVVRRVHTADRAEADIAFEKFRVEMKSQAEAR